MLIVLLVALAAGCPTVTDNEPYALAVVVDDDDTTDDDDDDSAPDDDDSAVLICDTDFLEERPEVSLGDDIEPMFFDHCQKCHVFQKQGQLTLSPGQSWAELVDVPNSLLYGEGDGMPRVTAGDPQQSYLFRKVLGCHNMNPDWGYFQGPMPPENFAGAVPLSDEQKSLIWSWILQGALDN